MDNNLNFLNELNNEQKQAVLENDYPLYIIAGAGTGKTKTLTSKVCYLIKNGVRPKNILTLTFTNKAADEMKERIISILEKEGMDNNFLSIPWILNFHKFGLKVLRSYIHLLDLGYENHFSIIDEDDLHKIIVKIIEKNFSNEVYKELKKEKKKIANLIYEERISKCLYPDLVSVYKVWDEEDSFITEDQFNKIYFEYEKYILNNNLIYFDDILIYTYKLFKEVENVRSMYERLFEYILVDEFQDTDILQFEILKLLRINNKKIFVVGDPNQSIYSFRGANFSNNYDFLNHFNARKIILNKNYRSTNSILEVANNLIKNNDKNSLELKSDYGYGLKPIIKSFEKDSYEASYIAKEVVRLLKSKNYKLSDISIIYRSNHLSRLVEKELVANHIPYQVFGGISFFERKEVKDIIAYLNIIIGNENSFYLKRILNIPKRNIGEKTQNLIIDLIDSGHKLKDIYENKLLDTKTHKKFEVFYQDILKCLNYFEENKNPGYIINDLLYKIGYFQYLSQEYPDNAKERLENVKELKNSIYENFENSNDKYMAIYQTLEDIAINSDNQKKDKKNAVGNELVTISTVHQVKGLEFKVVFVYGLNQDIFPIDNWEISEERRVAYVAITRAKELLYLTYSDTRLIYGKTQDMSKSQFLKELYINEYFNNFGFKNNNRVSSSNTVKKSINNSSKNNVYKFGQVVLHPIYGKGNIIEVSDIYIEVSFLADGIKKFRKDLVKLEILSEKLD